MQILENGTVVPTNGDAYNLTDDLATMGESAGVVVRVASLAARDALVNIVAGSVVSRTDLPGAPLETYDGTNWSVSDIEWTNLALVQGFTAVTTSGWSGLKYAVKNGWFIIDGAVARTTSWSADQTCAVIPAGLKPAHKIQGTGGALVEPTVGNVTLAAGSGAASFSATWPLF